MAGGRSERMRATNGPLHKALVEVAGAPLIEHNVRALLAAGLTEIVVVISADESGIEGYLRDRGARLAEAAGARIETYVETRRLGNIGAAGALDDGGHDLLMIYVDNLTSLSLPDLLATHRVTAAALTIATHVWELRNPFGELDVAAGRVRAYREKPVRGVRISSGTCVIAPAAARLIPAGRAYGAAELFGAVDAAGLTIAAFEHAAPWIDVNEARDVASAQRLFGEQAGTAAP